MQKQMIFLFRATIKHIKLEVSQYQNRKVYLESKF